MSISEHGSRAAWYLQRLRSMSVPEIGHRIEEQRRRVTGRFRAPPESPVAPAAGCWPELPGLREGVLALAHRSDYRALCRAAVADFRSGPTLLGRRFPAARPRRWWRDPVTGGEWEQDAYCFDIGYRRRDALGDVKYVLELNRLQYLQPVAAAALLDGDRELALECVSETADWNAANPPHLGLGWSSGIELALRVVSLLTITSLLGPEHFSLPLRRQAGDCLQAHGDWLRRFPSRYSSSNNHLIAEAAGLYLLGVSAPFLRDAERWRAYGRATLEREILRQIHPDGVGAEQSPTYTAFSLEWLLLCATIAERLQEPFSPAYLNRMRAAGGFLAWLTDCRGNLPRIGDDDEGRVLYAAADEPYAASIAVATGAGTPPGPCALFRDALLPRHRNTAPPAGARCFREGGYTVVRDRAGGGESLLVFDHGPLGYLSTAAHGHADALSVWLHVDGTPVLVDAGTFLYHGGGRWRDAFRGTRTHNTLTLDGRDSSTVSGPFNWSRHAQARLIRCDLSPGAEWVEAEHDGYWDSHRILHRRTLRRDGDTGWSIIDRLVGARRAEPVEINFLIHPALEVVRDEQGFLVLARGRPLVGLSCRHPTLTAVLVTGDGMERLGWYSPRFGDCRTATLLSLRGRLGRESAVTSLSLSRRGV